MRNTRSRDCLPAGARADVIQPDIGSTALNVENHSCQRASVRRKPHGAAIEPGRARSGKPFTFPVYPDELRAASKRLVGKYTLCRNGKICRAAISKTSD